MKKFIVFVMTLVLLCCSAFAAEMPALEIWAQFSDNQKALYSVMDEIEEEIEMIFEYLGCMEMADGSREIVDMLFIIAPEAEDGLYILDLQENEFYDHINEKKWANLRIGRTLPIPWPIAGSAATRNFCGMTAK